MENTIITTKGRPRSTAYKATKILNKKYKNANNGTVYNADGKQIGTSCCDEPRVTVHLGNNRKYGVRVAKAIAFVKYGPEALRKGVQVRHKNGDKYDNRSSNLVLVYSAAAKKAFRRLVAK